MPALTVRTAAERPELVAPIRELVSAPWPEFLDHDPVVAELWERIYELAPDFQFALLDGDELVAAGNCIPIRWNGDPATLPDRGFDAMLAEGVACLRDAAAATAASALAVVVDPGLRGRGLSAEALRAMREIAGRHGLADLVAPVRPTEKHRYPLIPIERYARWRREDGLPFDPWLRVHERIGGEIAGTAGAAMQVTGTVADWERWTGIALPESGSYVVPGALAPVRIDHERDRGEYTEPACWVRHRIDPR